MGEEGASKPTNDQTIAKLERTIRSVGGKNATIKSVGDPVSAFVVTGEGLKCSACGTLQTNPEATACESCGAVNAITLYVG